MFSALIGCASLTCRRRNACVFLYNMVAAVMAAFFYISVYRANMSILLIFKVLGNPAARIVAFYRFQIKSNNYPFVY
jgi:hypothetical protein